MELKRALTERQSLRRVTVAIAVLALLLSTFAVIGSVQTRRTSDFSSSAVDVLGTSQARSCGASGITLTAPATDLAAIVRSQPAGTCFTLPAGTYRFGNVVPKDNMSFLGAGADVVIVDGNGNENAFHGTADGVTIAGMTFDGFNGSGGTKRQEQAPIRGTSALWASFRGTMATNWTIDSVVSRNNFASGLFLGDNFQVTNSVFHGNGTTGIAGNEIVGGLLENNLVYGNGVYQAGGALVNGGGIKVTQAGTINQPLIVRNNEVHSNTDIGIWCDIACRGFHAVDNYIHDHRSSAIVIELSSGALIEGNRIERSSTWSDFGIDWNAGSITIAESADSVVRNNYIADARGGVIVRQTLRPSRPAESFLDNYLYVTYVVDNVTVENNVVVGADLMGFSTGQSGRGLVPNPSSVRFSGNRYDDPGSMSFSHGETRHSFSSWSASGRDAAQTGSIPPASNYGIGAGTTATSTPVAQANQSSTVATPTTVTVPQTPATPSTTAPAIQATVPLRINSGGSQLNLDGQTWLSDRFFVGGSSSNRDGEAIAQTRLDPLFASERWGLEGYSIPLPAGDYRVTLHHAELYEDCQRADCRVFDISVEGERVEADLDIFDTVGGRTALSLDTVASVTDGSLDISFGRQLQEPQVSAIEVVAVGQSAIDGASTPQRPANGTTSSPATSGTSSGGNAASTATTVVDGVPSSVATNGATAGTSSSATVGGPALADATGGTDATGSPDAAETDVGRGSQNNGLPIDRDGLTFEPPTAAQPLGEAQGVDGADERSDLAAPAAGGIEQTFSDESSSNGVGLLITLLLGGASIVLSVTARQRETK